MTFLREDDLRRYAYDQNLQKLAQRNFRMDSRGATVTIFLSHSHLDRIMVIGLIHIFLTYNISLYVDWNDNSMPRVTNYNTACQIKNRINENQFFMLLATENALNSRWVPWELGVADELKGNSKIFIIPVKKYNESFSGNEYLQLYQKIIYGDGRLLGFFEPNAITGWRLDYLFH